MLVEATIVQSHSVQMDADFFDPRARRYRLMYGRRGRPLLRPELRAMKPTAFLINNARGGLVDEAALAGVEV